jgi:hypothetical protein
MLAPAWDYDGEKLSSLANTYKFISEDTTEERTSDRGDAVNTTDKTAG